MLCDSPVAHYAGPFCHAPCAQIIEVLLVQCFTVLEALMTNQELCPLGDTLHNNFAICLIILVIILQIGTDVAIRHSNTSAFNLPISVLMQRIGIQVNLIA